MLKKNIVASLISNFWSFASVFLFVPIYIKILGVEAYGLVGFHAILISIFSIVDLGISMTLKREASRLSILGEYRALQDTVRTFEVVNITLALFVMFILWILAPVIAEYWLENSAFDSNEMITAVRLMGISIGLQLPSGLFVGAIMSLQHQIFANVLTIVASVLRIGCSLLFLLFFSPTINVLFFSYILANFIFSFISRYHLWIIIKKFGCREKPTFNFKIISGTGKFSISMASMSLIGILLNQTDKIVVGKLASLETFSLYTLAVTFASIPIMISSALSFSVFPMFTEIVANLDLKQLRKTYTEACEIVGLLIVPIFLTLFVFTKEILFIWTGSHSTSSTITITASLLLVGQFLQSLTTIPYVFALANGNIRISQRIGIGSILFVTPLLIVLTQKFGIFGAGMSWLILNAFVFPINIFYLHKQNIFFDKMWIVCLKSCTKPLLLTIPILWIFKYCLNSNQSRFDLFIQIFIAWLIVFCFSVLFSNYYTTMIKVRLVKYFRN